MSQTIGAPAPHDRMFTMSEAVQDALAAEAVSMVQPGMIVGIGSGTTAARALRFLADRVKHESLDISVIAASDATEAVCNASGLKALDFATVEELDLLIDGADEVDHAMRMMKGSGGAMTRERMLAWASDTRVFLVREHKISDRLGTRTTLAVAIMAFGLASTRAALRRMGLNGVLRRSIAGELFITDNGNLLLDVVLPEHSDVEDIARSLHAIPGVVDHGLFSDEADIIFVERGDGTVDRMERAED
ncbi:MAG: ribose-5-phosphate isomerase RpiA [Planctomycetota bacterium]